MSVKMATHFMVTQTGRVHQMVAGLIVKRETLYVKARTMVTSLSVTEANVLNSMLCIESLIQCDPLLNIPYGHVHYKTVDTTVIRPGDIVTYNCDTPYLLVGAEYRICISNGTWSEEEPQCIGEI